jgi:hypothetical protein
MASLDMLVRQASAADAERIGEMLAVAYAARRTAS